MYPDMTYYEFHKWMFYLELGGEQTRDDLILTGWEGFHEAMRPEWDR